MTDPSPYTTDPTFWNEYISMVPTDYEGKVTGVWDVIMQHYFPKYTYQWVPQSTGPDLQYPFLVTQCKREARDEIQAFREGEAQLNRYMPALQAQAWGNPIYGIIAVGKRVRFYILSGGRVEFWLGRTKYEINTHGHIVHRRLMHIRNHHT